MTQSNSGAERVREAIDDSVEVAPEAPRPLMRELPSADPFPVDALGDELGPAARAIHDLVQAPVALCGQSVLGAATLAVQGHADVKLPTGQKKPLSNFLVSVAATGERKTAVDEEALRPMRKREAALRERYQAEHFEYQNAHEAWDAARAAGIKGAKGDRARIREMLDALGPAPLVPLYPLLTCGEPTFEGLCRLFADGQPSIGLFASEGGQFIGGHGMAEDAKLRTASGLSILWDGGPIKRVRGGDGVTVLPDRRLAMHLMAQPNIAAFWFSDSLLLEQGLMSRVLVTAPEAASGRRLWRDASAETRPIIERYGARMLDILERPLPIVAGGRNELNPRLIELSPDAQQMWIAFHDHVEVRLGVGGELEPVRGLANKLPEHATRIAAVLTLINDIGATELGGVDMARGIVLAQHFAAEALRLFEAGRVSGGVREAQRLLEWLLTNWTEPLISLPDIYQRGPNSIRDAQRARRAATILEEHGWLISVAAGGFVGEIFRREVWRIVRE
jgi:hypothetical protein